MKIEGQVEVPKSVIFSGQAEAIITRGMLQFLTRALRKGKEIAWDETPIGATVNLRGSIATPILKGTSPKFEGAVRWGAPYAQTVDKGSPPRKVNLQRLQAWASVVLGNPDAARKVQKAIQRRGTPSPNHPNPGKGMSDRLFTKWSAWVDPTFESAMDKVIRNLGR